MSTIQNRNEVLASDTDGDIVNGIFTGFAQFLVLENALKTDILDQLEEERSPVSVATLSKKHGYNTDILERLLDNLAGLKLVNKSKDSDSWKYSNTRASSIYLTKNSPVYKGGAMQSDKMLVEKTSANLCCTLKKGPENRMQKFVESGKMTNGNFDNDDENGDENRNINNTGAKKTTGQENANATNLNSPQNKQPQSTNNPCSGPTDGQRTNSLNILMKSMDAMMYSCRHVIPKIFDLSGHRVAVDLGGGSGYLARLLTNYYPLLQTTVFELPPVVAASRAISDNTTTNDRVTFMAGDFFHDDLPPADLYIVSRVLHALNDSLIDVLLSKIYQSLPPGGKLLVMEKFLNERKDGPSDILYIYLNMSSICDGRERTAEEYEALVESHGFADTRYKIVDGVNLFDGLLTCKPF